MICSKCHLDLPKSEYSGKSRRCKRCCCEAAKARYAASEECRRRSKERAAAWKRRQPVGYRRFQALWEKYGIKEGEWLAIAERQGGRCAVCDKAAKLVVDHCHQTGKIRGLLCVSCNSTIGKLGDQPEAVRESIQRIMEYLLGGSESHGAQ